MLNSTRLKKNLGIWRVILAFLAPGLGGCASHAREAVPTHQRRADGAVVLHGPSLAYVKVEAAGTWTGARTRTLVARVTFDDRKVARVGPPVGGRVASVNFVAGDHVAAGAVLLTIHSPDIATAQAQVAETHTARVLADQAWTRAALLVRQGAGSQADALSAQAAAEEARDEERRARASLAAIGGGHGTSDYQLRSPLEGTLVERTVAVGNEVSVGQTDPLMTIADLSTVWVTADVYETDLALIHVGDPASVEVSAYPGRRFVGRMAYIGDVIDPVTRTSHARIELGNTDGALRPGMFARVEVSGRGDGAVEVPTSAVLARRDQFFVFIRSPDGSFVQREVRVGEQHGQHITLLEGVRPGDPVVTEGAILLDAEANEAL